MSACYKCATQTTNAQCENCGATTSCTSCGVWLKGPFCTNCGTPAEDVAASARGDSPTRPAPRASQMIGEFSSSTWKTMKERELPAWADANPVQPPDDEFGGTFHWAFGAFRRNLVGFALLSLLVGVTSFVTGFFSGILTNWGADSRFTFAMVVTIIITTFISFLVGSWGLMVAGRAWSQVVRGVDINIAECLSLTGVLPCLAAYALLAPISAILPPIVYPVLIMAFLFVVADGLQATAAIGQAFRIYFSDARTFFRMLAVGIIGMITMWITLFAGFFLWAELSAGAAQSSLVTSFTDQNQLFEAEMNASLILGTLSIVLIAFAVLYATFHIMGLWLAAFVRHHLGKPIGAIETLASEGPVTSQPVGTSS